MVDEEDITANVVHALELNSPRVRAMIERSAQKFASQLLEFFGVEGSLIHRALEAHEVSDLRMVLRIGSEGAEQAAA